MQVRIEHRPSYALATALLGPNEEIQLEAGSMVSMSQASLWIRGRQEVFCQR